ncbi:MAG: FtsB family cell division protein [Actinomycetota bacterium]
MRPSFHRSVLALTLIVLGVMAVTPARQLYDQHRQITAAQRDLERLGARNAKLQDRLDRLKDPDYLERLAREELGFVRPGEVSYLVVPPDPPPAPPQPPAPPPPKPKPWHERPWERVRNLLNQP